MRTKNNIVTVLFVVGMASVASAAVTAYEAFDYTVGLEHLRDVSPWVAPTTQTPHEDFDVYAGSLGYTDGLAQSLVTGGNSAGRRDKGIPPDTSNRSDVESTLNAATQALFTATQSIYVSLLWQSGSGAVGFRNKNVGPGWTGGFHLDTDKNYWGPGFKLTASDIDGVGSASNTGTQATWDFSPARFYVLKIDNVAGGNETISAIFDPTDLTTEPSWATPDMQVTGIDIGTPDKLWLYVWPETSYGDGANHTRTGLHIDEIRIGTSWADVTPIPEPATLSVLGIGCVLALLRRRR